MDPINVINGWSWSNFICGAFCGLTGGVCALAGCAVDGPSPVADAALLKLSIGGGTVASAVVGGFAG
ncbi:secretion system protein E (plasmid) [Clostridium septicum]|uniref:hypothetical protein n=1 Tax=Clostridium septicum TaxID=1504 RepID=UPI0008356923|nr:hypothetical protein [Clostridium septicum]